jgi:DNA polymerase III delta subunit
MIKLIWAQDELLATEATDDLLASVTESGEVVTIDADAGLDALEEALFAGSLFATERYVVVRNLESLSKSGVERLASAFQQEGQPASAILIAVAERPPTQLLTALKGVAEEIRLPRPRRGELAAWVTKRMKRAGLQPGKDAAVALVESVGEGLRDLAQAVDQIALRKGSGARIDRSDVGQHFSSAAEQPIWVLFDAIIQRNTSKAFDSLRRLFEHGDEPLAVLGALVSQVRGVIRAKSAVARSPSLREGDLASALGVSPGRAAVLRRQAGRLGWDWLLGVHRLCAEADYELKGGEDGAVLPAEIVLERVVAGALDAG